MGYKREAKAFKLKFEDASFDGLEVTAKSLNVEQFMRVTELLPATGNVKEDNTNMDALFNIFTEALVDWNLEDEDGKPVPKTVEGVKSQEHSFMIQVAISWITAIGDVEQNLGKTSNPGVNMEQLPMETL